jgi:hypothetical protein
MAESFLQPPVDGSGQKLRVESVTVGANTVIQQVVTLADSTGNLINATSNRLQVDGSGVTQPVSVANGSDVTQGAIADSAYAGSGSGTVIAVLKGLYALLAATLTFKKALGTTTASSGSLTTTSSTIIAANTSRKSLLVKNNSSVIIYLNFNATAATNTDASLAIDPGDSYYDELSSSAITGRSASGTASITVVEVA